MVETEEDLQQVDPTRHTHLYSQTTKSLGGLRHIAARLEEHMAEGVEFTSFDTICRSVAHRVDNLRMFARKHDAVVFVAGRKSSNGKFLYDECRAVNPRTMFISGVDELDVPALRDASSIGICGATSTPRWLMEQVKEKINSYEDK